MSTGGYKPLTYRYTRLVNEPPKSHTLIETSQTLVV